MLDKQRRHQMAKKCVEDAQKILGDGWYHVSQEVRWGLVCSNIVAVVNGQDETIPAENVRQMLSQLSDLCRGMVFC